MKIFRYLQNGSVKQGIAVDGKHFDVSDFGEDFNEVFFESGGMERLSSFVKDNELNILPDELLFAAPFARPSKIVCIGLNYAEHAKETGATPPAEPVVFMKSSTALVGPNDNIIIPKNSVKTDWEVELAVVISKKASYVSEESAMNHVAGYCLHNDISEREFQIERGGTWDKGKGCDTFAPMGPYLVTPDEIKDVNNLRLWLNVNGQKMQDGSTSTLIFKIPFIISYVSQFMTLLPGDVISTGTPAGVGLGMNPQVYLKPGDVVELGIDGLGEAKQNVVAYSAQ
jgi:2-keto-4-pentenoate hydratase/2-oxohepta-3-ene-1,7-dioic acid hydratase in catechol pathway